LHWLGIQKSMNWDDIAFDWNQVRAFLATSEEGSLSAAARALNQTQPTLSRQVTGLEQSLGVTLFERGHRQVRLTVAGLELLEHVRAMAEAANLILSPAASDSLKGAFTPPAACWTRSAYRILLTTYPIRTSWALRILRR
jgi:DNA-binding transcriptional LysR family regulator